MSGFVYIDRAILNHHVVGIANPKRFAAWVWMISEACWKDTKYNLNGTTIDLKRGQFVASRKRISEKTGLSDKEIRGLIARLEREGMVSKKGQRRANTSSILTICNYDTYQDVENYKEHKRASEGPTKGQRRANKRRREEGKEEEYTSNFEDFWKVFSDSRGKGGAKRVWQRKKLDNKASEVIAGAKRYVTSRGVDRKYWKQAQGWLNDERWLDEVSKQSTVVSIHDFEISQMPVRT